MSAAAADGGWTLGAFVCVSDGVDGKSGAVAFVKHMSVVKGGDPPLSSAPTLSRTLSPRSFGFGLPNLLNMAPMTGGAYDAAALAPHLDADGKLRVSAVVRALG